jgi:hypothetical protein
VKKEKKEKKSSRTFKTSWGVEYTLMVNKNKDESSLEPTIDDLVEKSRKEKQTKKKK